MIVPGSRFVYATGRLVFWSPGNDLANQGCDDVLVDAVGKIAVANPRHAPYGAAAIAHMKSKPWYGDVSERLVYGENIAQTFQFVATGNAQYGFVALSQLAADKRKNVPCIIDAQPVAPLTQEGVVLRRAMDSAAARAFVEFLKSRGAREIIASYGYEVDAR